MPDEGGLDPDVLITLGVDASQLPEGIRRAVTQIAPQFKELQAQLESLRLGQIDSSQFTTSLQRLREQANQQTIEMRKSLSLSSVDLKGVRDSYTALFRSLREQANAAGIDIKTQLRSAQSSVNAALRPTAQQKAYPNVPSGNLDAGLPKPSPAQRAGQTISTAEREDATRAAAIAKADAALVKEKANAATLLQRQTREADGRTQDLATAENNYRKSVESAQQKRDQAVARAQTQAQRAGQTEQSALTEDQLRTSRSNLLQGFVSGDVSRVGKSSFFKDNESGSYLDRNGEVIDRNSNKFIELTAALEAERAAILRGTAAADKKAEADIKAGLPAPGFFGSYRSGIAGKGYSSQGQGVIGSLAGTTGILSKYAIGGIAIGAAVGGATKGFQEVEQAQTELVTLKGVQDALEQATGGAAKTQIDFNAALADGAKLGLGATDVFAAGTVGIRNYSDEIRNGADANKVFTDSVTAAGVAASITGQQLAVAQQNLFQAANAFGLKSNQVGQVNDAVLAASRSFNASPSQILTGIGQAGDLAGVAGFDVNSLASTVGAIINTGAPASGLARLLSKGGDAQFTGGLAALGVNNTGNIAQELQQMAEGYSKLNDAQKLAFAQSVGGARSASILIAVLTQQQKIIDETTQSYTNAGQAEEQTYKQTQTLGGQVRQFSADLKQLAQEVGNSGAFTPLAVAFEAVKTALEGVNFAFSIFDKLDSTTRKLVLTTLELAAAYAAVSKAGGIGAIYNKSIGRIPGLPGGTDSKSIVAQDANTAATNRNTEALLGKGIIGSPEGPHFGPKTRDETAQTERGIAGLFNKIGTFGGRIGTGASGGGFGIPLLARGGLLTVGGLGAGIVAGGLADAYSSYKVADKNYAQTDSIDAATNARIEGKGTSADLLQSAKELSKTAADARHSSSGFLGGFVNLDRSIGHDVGISGYGSTEGAARQAQRYAEIAATLGEAQQKREADASNRNGLNGIDFNSQSGFSTYAQAQASQGRAAIDILKNSSQAFNTFLDQSGKSGSTLATGSTDAVAGQYANDFIKNLLAHANDVLDSDPRNKAAKAVSSLNADQAKAVAGAAQGSFTDFVNSNNLSGTDLSNLTQDQRNALAKNTQQKVKEALSAAGVKGVTDEFVSQLAGTAAISFKDIVNNVNPISGQKLTYQQVNDFVTSQVAQAQAAQQRGANQDTVAAYGNVGLPQTSQNLQAAQTALSEFQSKLAGLKAAAEPNADAIRLMQDAIDGATIAVHQAADAFGQAQVAANAAALSVGSTSTGYSQASSFLNGGGPTSTPVGNAGLGIDLGNITTNTSGALDSLGKSLGFQAFSQSDLTSAATPGSQIGSAVQAKALAEQNYYNAVQQNKTQQEIDSAHRAYLDASLQLEQSRQQDAAQSALAAVAIGDTVNEALAQQKILFAQADITADPGAKAALERQAQQQGINATLAQTGIDASQALANIGPGDTLGAASQTLQNDRNRLQAIKDTTPKDLKAIADAQAQINSDIVSVVSAYSTYIQDLNSSQIDTTDPAQVAKAALATSQAALTKAQQQGISGDALRPYQNAVKDATTTSAGAAFQEQQQVLQDQLDLHQVSNQSFIASQQQTLAGLRAQLATMKIGDQGFKQVQDEITAVSKSILATAAQATGQFNIGNIKIPTPYEVQRSIAASGVGAGYNVMPVTNNTSIIINGTDLAAVQAILSQYLGSPLTSHTTAPRKV